MTNVRPFRLTPLAAILLAGLAGSATAQGAAGSAASACVTPSESEIVALSDRWARALADGRVDDVAGLYAENAVLMAEGQAPLSGRTAIKGYLEQFAKRHPEARVDMRTISTRCGLASEMTATRFQVTGQRKGTRMFVGGRTSTVYAYDGGTWRITQQSLPTMTVPNRAR